MDLVWKDVTSYDRGERGKIAPKAWSTTLPEVDVYVALFRVNKLYPDNWVVICRSVNMTEVVGPSNLSLETAQEQSLYMIREKALKEQERFEQIVKVCSPQTGT